MSEQQKYEIQQAKSIRNKKIGEAHQKLNWWENIDVYDEKSRQFILSAHGDGAGEREFFGNGVEHQSPPANNAIHGQALSAAPQQVGYFGGQHSQQMFAGGSYYNHPQAISIYQPQQAQVMYQQQAVQGYGAAQACYPPPQQYQHYQQQGASFGSMPYENQNGNQQYFCGNPVVHYGDSSSQQPSSGSYFMAPMDSLTTMTTAPPGVAPPGLAAASLQTPTSESTATKKASRRKKKNHLKKNKVVRAVAESSSGAPSLPMATAQHPVDQEKKDKLETAEEITKEVKTLKPVDSMDLAETSSMPPSPPTVTVELSVEQKQKNNELEVAEEITKEVKTLEPVDSMDLTKTSSMPQSPPTATVEPSVDQKKNDNLKVAEECKREKVPALVTLSEQPAEQLFASTPSSFPSTQETLATQKPTEVIDQKEEKNSDIANLSLVQPSTVSVLSTPPSNTDQKPSVDQKKENEFEVGKMKDDKATDNLGKSQVEMNPLEYARSRHGIEKPSASGEVRVFNLSSKAPMPIATPKKNEHVEVKISSTSEFPALPSSIPTKPAPISCAPLRPKITKKPKPSVESAYQLALEKAWLTKKETQKKKHNNKSSEGKKQRTEEQKPEEKFVPPPPNPPKEKIRDAEGFELVNKTGSVKPKKSKNPAPATKTPEPRVDTSTPSEPLEASMPSTSDPRADTPVPSTSEPLEAPTASTSDPLEASTPSTSSPMPQTAPKPAPSKKTKKKKNKSNSLPEESEEEMLEKMIKEREKFEKEENAKKKKEEEEQLKKKQEEEEKQQKKAAELQNGDSEKLLEAQEINNTLLQQRIEALERRPNVTSSETAAQKAIRKDMAVYYEKYQRKIKPQKKTIRWEVFDRLSQRVTMVRDKKDEVNQFKFNFYLFLEEKFKKKWPAPVIEILDIGNFKDMLQAEVVFMRSVLKDPIFAEILDKMDKEIEETPDEFVPTVSALTDSVPTVSVSIVSFDNPNFQK